MPGFTVQIGKDVTISGVDNARSVTVTASASDIDVTMFTLSGTNTGNVDYIVTGVVRDEPLDDIITYKVSGKKTPS